MLNDYTKYLPLLAMASWIAMFPSKHRSLFLGGCMAWCTSLPWCRWSSCYLLVLPSTLLATALIFFGSLMACASSTNGHRLVVPSGNFGGLKA